MVPDWLIGTWTRTYIRRRLPDLPPHSSSKEGTAEVETAHLDKPDSTIQVRYIQTPWAFIDIRSKVIINHNILESQKTVSKKEEQPMAFAGITTVVTQSRDDIPPLVHWYSCLDYEEGDDELYDPKSRWEAAERDKPRHTNDVGYFVRKENDENTYYEYDPDRTLLEEWVRLDSPTKNECLAARSECGNLLLIVAGKYFGYANQKENVFVSGIIHFGKKTEDENHGIERNISSSRWVIETSVNEKERQGNLLRIPSGVLWISLKGSILNVDAIIDYLSSYYSCTE